MVVTVMNAEKAGAAASLHVLEQPLPVPTTRRTAESQMTKMEPVHSH